MELADSHTSVTLEFDVNVKSVRSICLGSCVDEGLYFSKNLLEPSWHFSNVSNKSLL